MKTIQRIYSDFKIIEFGIFLTETLDFLLINYMVVIQTMFINLTSLCHIMLKGLFTLSGTYTLPNVYFTECIPYRMYTLPNVYFTECILYRMYVFGLYLRINDSDVFDWISRTVLSRICITYLSLYTLYRSI